MIHPDGWQTGDIWVQCGIKFDRVKITNNTEDPRGNVYCLCRLFLLPVFAFVRQCFAQRTPVYVVFYSNFRYSFSYFTGTVTIYAEVSAGSHSVYI